MMKRRDVLLGLAATGLAAPAMAGSHEKKMIMPWEWIQKKDEVKNTDGTPLQFMPKTAPDPNPLENEFAKYPRCPYCGMMRKKFSYSRHLIQYSDDVVDGTCSIHCAAISLSLNLDRVPKAIYAGDAGSDANVKPLVNVEKAKYVINPSRMGTMTKHSKFAYADPAKATAAAVGDAKVVSFDEALTEAYLDMAKDTIMIRKRRDEKRRKAKKS